MNPDKSSAERGNIRPFGFLVWKETQHYLNFVSNYNLYYVLNL